MAENAKKVFFFDCKNCIFEVTEGFCISTFLATKRTSSVYSQKRHSTTSPCSRLQSMAAWGRYVERSR